MKIKIAIGTNKGFFNKTLPIIIPSLLKAGIEPDDIHVFNGGFDTYTYQIIDGIHHHQVDHNSIDYTALIEICDKRIESDYWFFIHDTAKVGEKFKELLYNIPENKPEKIALKARPSMSIGTYRFDYLMSIRDKMIAIKNKNYTEEGLLHWKNWGVPNEDYILWQTDPQPAIYPNSDWKVVDYENWYGTGTPRRTEYYTALDLYKNKANWGQTSLYTVKM